MGPQLGSFVVGAWRQPSSAGVEPVRNPTTDETIASFGAPDFDAGEALAWARRVGCASIEALGWARRGQLLAELAGVLTRARDELLQLSILCGGNTRDDAKFDIDGAIGVLKTYAALARERPDGPWLPGAGGSEPLFPRSVLHGRQLLVPRRGVAVQIQAFNFPVWGMVGKLAVAFLAGMPVVSKPAAPGSPLAVRVAELLTASGGLPDGAFQLWLGSGAPLLDHLEPLDVVAFTGSAETGRLVRGHPRVVATGARVNVEADSINAAIVGLDLDPSHTSFARAVRDCAFEITQKAGQKCTATRRIFVPRPLIPPFREALVGALEPIAGQTGDPSLAEVRMGPLASAQQRSRVRAGIEGLARWARPVFGDPQRQGFLGVGPGVGAFLEPVVFEAEDRAAALSEAAFHRDEVFGPVATLIPYDDPSVLGAWVGFGGGSLVATLYSSDDGFLSRVARDVAPWVGRLVLVDAVSDLATGPSSGAVFPGLPHGGPGRAGDGSELGGPYGCLLYCQRVGLQGTEHGVQRFSEATVGSAVRQR